MGQWAYLGLPDLRRVLKAEPEPQRVIASVSVSMDESQIVKIVRNNYMRGGALREAVQNDREWGL